MAYEAEELASKKARLKVYSTGVRYGVRCLDASTMRGMVGSLEEAMQIIKKDSD